MAKLFLSRWCSGFPKMGYFFFSFPALKKHDTIRVSWWVVHGTGDTTTKKSYVTRVWSSHPSVQPAMPQVVTIHMIRYHALEFFHGFTTRSRKEAIGRSYRKHSHPKKRSFLVPNKQTKILLKTSWWFQHIWNIIVNLDHFPIFGVKIKHIWNHHLEDHSAFGSTVEPHLWRDHCLSSYTYTVIYIYTP